MKKNKIFVLAAATLVLGGFALLKSQNMVKNHWANDEIQQRKNTYLDFQYQIIGPKVEKTRFDEFLKIRPANSAQKEYLKFFGLQIASDMTSGQAEEAIEKHQKVSEEGEQEQWLGYASIIDDFADSDFRDCHELKKVPKTVLLAAIDQLRQEGKTYTYLGDNIEELVDRVLKIRPELQKSA